MAVVANIAGANKATSPRPRRAPQDRLPKKTERSDVESLFEFTDDAGVVHTAGRLLSEVITPGVLRRNRADEFALYCELVEALFDGDEQAMAAIDGSWDVLKRVVEALQDEMKQAASRVGASLGESSDSST